MLDPNKSQPPSSVTSSGRKCKGSDFHEGRMSINVFILTEDGWCYWGCSCGGGDGCTGCWHCPDWGWAVKWHHSQHEVKPLLLVSHTVQLLSASIRLDCVCSSHFGHLFVWLFCDDATVLPINSSLRQQCKTKRIDYFLHGWRAAFLLLLLVWFFSDCRGGRGTETAGERIANALAVIVLHRRRAHSLYYRMTHQARENVTLGSGRALTHIRKRALERWLRFDQIIRNWKAAFVGSCSLSQRKWTGFMYFLPQKRTFKEKDTQLFISLLKR